MEDNANRDRHGGAPQHVAADAQVNIHSPIDRNTGSDGNTSPQPYPDSVTDDTAYGYAHSNADVCLGSRAPAAF